MNILEVKSLKVSFDTQQGPVEVLKGMNFGLEEGKVLGLLGQSGSGKTVTACAIMNLLGGAGGVTEGEIIFENRNILNLSEKEMQKVRGRGLFMIFQSPASSLNPSIRIVDQVAEAFLIRRESKNYGSSRRSALKWAEALLMEMGLKKDALRSYPFQLSGGMRQRVLIAMAVALEPKVLIADEPTTGLDPVTQMEILELMKRWRKRIGGSILLITHDLRLAAKTADDLAVVHGGRIVDYAPAGSFFCKAERHPHALKLLS